MIRESREERQENGQERREETKLNGNEGEGSRERGEVTRALTRRSTCNMQKRRQGDSREQPQ